MHAVIWLVHSIEGTSQIVNKSDQDTDILWWKIFGNIEVESLKAPELDIQYCSKPPDILLVLCGWRNVILALSYLASSLYGPHQTTCIHAYGCDQTLHNVLEEYHIFSKCEMYIHSYCKIICWKIPNAKTKQGEAWPGITRQDDTALR